MRKYQDKQDEVFTAWLLVMQIFTGAMFIAGVIQWLSRWLRQ